MNIFTYYKKKIKQRLGVCSPSAQWAALGRSLCLGFATGRLAAILRGIEESAFGQYEPKTFVHVPEYEPLTSLVREFKESVAWHMDD